MLRRGVSQPLTGLTQAITLVAQGDLTQSFETTRRDEIGTLVREVEGMRLRYVQMLQEVRTAVDSIDTASVYSNAGPAVDPAAARARAQAFLDSNGWSGTVTADTQTVTVTIDRTQHLAFLTMFGLGDRPVTGVASAHPERGLATH